MHFSNSFPCRGMQAIGRQLLAFFISPLLSLQWCHYCIFPDFGEFSRSYAKVKKKLQLWYEDLAEILNKFEVIPVIPELL